ncbi:uncharacterized protein F4807DRAFT_436892 [Annulohypoxylon truncatum]|uniref:uncharacterized protein n=1 Tax=Annulohypoxylon truncatum TaxID=327061 RepID=UPI002008C3C2|nr:uncharacterized protein F4807DRAFT_436892 [Annulohypoxylon truncatum]KAI1207056.1 hypothetical protein F4807DRAFT_436892 [Annulohypoxylon truncatum]
MLRGIPFPSMYGTSSTLCRRCLLQSFAARRHQARHISTSFLQKQAEAEAQWAERAQSIKEGKIPHLWDTLKERGYVKDIAGNEGQLKELMRDKRIGAYVGIDPTAPSLHVGHLLPLMALFWMYINGYRAISLVGGATAKIGDPTDRLKSREPMTGADISRNITKVHYQLKRLWVNLEALAPRYGYQKEKRVWSRALHNNSIWYSSLSFTEIIGRLFSGVRLSTLLSRDTVKNKMEKGDGMTVDELIYPLLQAWDFWMMFKRNGVRMQIGGSDQYGNIVSGVEAVKYIRDNEPNPSWKFPKDLFHTPFGFTTPLLTDSSGNKFGKSAGNAVWLDPFMTTPFDMYGYWMRRPDDDVERLLKLFTFLPLEEIAKIVEKHKEDPPKRVAQHALAFEVVALVHSFQEAVNTQNRHKGLFSKGDTEVTKYPSEGPANASTAAAFQCDIQLPESLIMGKSISRILFAAGLADSITDAHRLTKHQGAYVGGRPGSPNDPLDRAMRSGDLSFTPIKNWFPQETQNYLIDKKLLILRRGKHFVRVVEMVTDEEWSKRGMTYPGQPGTGKVRQLQAALKQAAESEGLRDDPETVKRLVDRVTLLYSKEEKLYDLYSPKVDKEWILENEKGSILGDVQENRAQTILRQSMRHIRHLGPQSAKSKTDAIDEAIRNAAMELGLFDSTDGKAANLDLPVHELSDISAHVRKKASFKPGYNEISKQRPPVETNKVKARPPVKISKVKGRSPVGINTVEASMIKDRSD